MPSKSAQVRGARVAQILLGLATGLYVAHLLTAGVAHQTVDTRPDTVAPNSPQAVLAKHRADCWTGDAPADVTLPGHVIWQYPDGRTVHSRELVGPALETVFGDDDLPGRPIAFCR